MMEIQLSNGGVAWVDDEDYELVKGKSWRRFPVEGITYAAHSLWVKETKKTTHVLMHRVIMKAEKGQQVDHANRDGLDNRRTNLRFSSIAENLYNSKKRKNSLSIYKGVSRTSTGRLWRARLWIDGVETFLGSYASPIEAARAYDVAALKYCNGFAKTNFPVESYERS